MATKAQKSQLGLELGALGIGAAVGGVLGMLFAPQSGKQTRKAVTRGGKRLAASAVKTVKKIEKKGAKTVRATAKRSK